MTEYHMVELTVDGTSYVIIDDVRATLLDVLRERLHVTGIEQGCDHAACGACAVMVDGRSVPGCLTLAASIDGSDVRTIDTDDGRAES